MHFRNTAVLTTAVVVALCQFAFDRAEAQLISGARVRVHLLKLSTFEHGAGQVMVGPQSALELEWRVLNETGVALRIPSLDAVLRLRVSGQGRAIPTRY